MSITWLTEQPIYSPAVWAQLIRAANNRRQAMGLSATAVTGYASGTLATYPTNTQVSAIRQDLRGIKHFITQLNSMQVTSRGDGVGSLRWTANDYSTLITFESLPAVNSTNDIGPWIAAYRRNVDLMQWLKYEGTQSDNGNQAEWGCTRGSPYTHPSESDFNSPGQIATELPLRACFGVPLPAFSYQHTTNPTYGSLGRLWGLIGNITWDLEQVAASVAWKGSSETSAAGLSTGDGYLALYLRDPAVSPAAIWTAAPTPYIQRILEVTESIHAPYTTPATGSASNTATLDATVKEMSSVQLAGWAFYGPEKLLLSDYVSSTSGKFGAVDLQATITLHYTTPPTDADEGFL